MPKVESKVRLLYKVNLGENKHKTNLLQEERCRHTEMDMGNGKVRVVGGMREIRLTYIHQRVKQIVGEKLLCTSSAQAQDRLEVRGGCGRELQEGRDVRI